MKKFILLALPFLFLACHRAPSPSARLLEVEKYATNAPNRAFVALDSMAAGGLTSSADTALYNLLYQEALLRKGLTTRNDSDIAHSVAYYERVHDRQRLMRSLLSLGQTLVLNRDFSDGIVKLKAAQRMADEQDDDSLQRAVHTALGDANDEAGCYELAVGHYQKALQLTDSIRHREQYAETLLRLAQAYEHRGAMDSFLVCMRRVQPLLSKNEIKAQGLNILAEYYYRSGDKERARHYAEMVSETGLRYMAARILGDMEEEAGHPEQAVAYYYEAIDSQDYETRVWAYSRLVDYFKRNGDKDEALVYSLRLLEEYSHRKKLDSNRLAVYQANADLQWEQQQASRRIHLAVGIAIGLLAVLTVVGLGLRWRNRRLRSQLETLNREYNRYLQQYHEQSQQLAEMERQGTVTASELRQKQAEIDDLQQKIAAYQEDATLPKAWHDEGDLLNADLVFQLHDLAARGAKPEPALWQQLNDLFNQYLPTFIPTINARTPLTQREQSVCELVRLRFLPSEIAALMITTPQAITNLRAHLMQKIFGEKGGARQLDERMRSIGR